MTSPYRFSDIRRSQIEPKSLAVTTSLGTTEAFSLDGYSAFALRSPAGTGNTLTLYADFDGTGTYTICKDTAGTDMAVTLASTSWFVFPLESLAFTRVKLVGSAADTIQLVGRG